MPRRDHQRAGLLLQAEEFEHVRQGEGRDVSAEARRRRRAVTAPRPREHGLERGPDLLVFGLERRRAEQRAARFFHLTERGQREAEVVGRAHLVRCQLFGGAERLGRLVPALDPLIGEAEAAVALRRFRIDAERVREAGDRVLDPIRREQGVGEVGVRRAELGAQLLHPHQERERLVVLPVRRQDDAEARDRIQILTARHLDDPPQATDGARDVAGLLENGGQAAVRVMMMGVVREDRAPVRRCVVEQSELFVGGRCQCVQIVIVGMPAQGLDGDLTCALVVASFEREAGQLDLGLGAARKPLDGPAQHMLRVGRKARERELRRDVQHGFETIRRVFQALQ